MSPEGGKHKGGEGRDKGRGGRGRGGRGKGRGGGRDNQGRDNNGDPSAANKSQGTGSRQKKSVGGRNGRGGGRGGRGKSRNRNQTKKESSKSIQEGEAVKIKLGPKQANLEVESSTPTITDADDETAQTNTVTIPTEDSVEEEEEQQANLVVSDEDKERRKEEMEALLALYEEGIVQRSTIYDYQSESDQDCWQIQISPQVSLELQLPTRYPSEEAPIPRIKAPQYILNDAHLTDLYQELKDMWTEDTEVAILWAEHCRMFLEEMNESRTSNLENSGDAVKDGHDEEAEETVSTSGTHTIVPLTSKFGQPVRHFDLSVIQNGNNQRTIYHGAPFRPPKSGASETLVAHVASVESMDHVNWVLAELLGDKKVAKATHNMIAYKFEDANGRLVSDNDDDGEKGSGAKLGALLDMADVENVMVVVSRWYGGIHLGSARFKWFASVARDALEESGFLKKQG